ncbi:MAG TPA: cell division protein FtsA, partial [Vulgatibacter sp.]
MAKKGELIVGLDIGTTKICAIVGEVTDDGIDIIGIGSHPSKGLRKGVVVNIEATVSSIKRAIEEAELMAGCEINTVYTGIAGGHIKGFNSQGIVAVKDKEVREADIQRVIDAAKAVAIPLDREVIHVLPQEYVIDEQGGIKEPLGMAGVRLEAKVHIVTGAVSSAQNIIKCAARTGLNVADIVLQPLASAEAVLGEDEKELGVCLVDIGGGTTDIAIFSGGSIAHTGVIALGGNNLTSDIAIGLRTPAHEAERIKQKAGCCMPSMVGEDETIEVPSVGGRQPREVPRQLLVDIIMPRVEEIFEHVRKEIVRSGHQDLLASGIV